MLCVGELCVNKWCVRELCVSNLCVRELCVRVLCVGGLCAAKQGTAATHRAVGTPLVDQTWVRDGSRLSFNVALYFLMRHGP